MRPGRYRRRFDRYAVQPGDAAAQHRHLVEAGARRRPHKRFEAGKLVRLDIDEEEAGRLGRQAAFDLAGKIALDQRDRDEHGQADAEGQHDLGRRRTRAVQIG